MKLDLLTNATVVDDAIRFVSGMSKKLKPSANDSEHNKESNEPDYDEDEHEDQLEEKQEEKETGEANQITINQVF
jgi:hypothetical protein